MGILPQGLSWYNPNTFSRQLVSACGVEQTQANATAWHEGVRRLEHAVRDGRHFAIETTLGGHSMTTKIAQAAETHDVLMWFCGLGSVQLHLDRVKARVAVDGHDIPEAKIRERYVASRRNLIGLMPKLKELTVMDNSRSVAPGSALPDPLLVLHVRDGSVLWPASGSDLALTPDWAKPVVEAALAGA